MANKSDDEVREEFQSLVNMSPEEMDEWLQQPESKSAGQREEGEKESKGHKSGRRIADILEKDKPDDDDMAHMRKVAGYIKRHLAQRPDGDISETRWRYSLMNWGHDPLKS